MVAQIVRQKVHTADLLCDIARCMGLAMGHIRRLAFCCCLRCVALIVYIAPGLTTSKAEDLDALIGNWVNTITGESLHIKKAIGGVDLFWKLGQFSITKDGHAGAHIKASGISLDNELICYYYVTWTARTEMVWKRIDGPQDKCPQGLIKREITLEELERQVFLEKEAVKLAQEAVLKAAGEAATKQAIADAAKDASTKANAEKDAKAAIEKKEAAEKVAQTAISKKDDAETTAKAVSDKERSSDEQAPDFMDVRVVYFERSADMGKIESALIANKVLFTKYRSSHDIAVNILVCGPKTPISAIKQMLRILIGVGAPIRVVQRQEQEYDKNFPSRISVESYYNDQVTKAPLIKMNEIEEISSCSKNEGYEPPFNFRIKNECQQGGRLMAYTFSGRSVSGPVVVDYGQDIRVLSGRGSLPQTWYYAYSPSKQMRWPDQSSLVNTLDVNVPNVGSRKFRKFSGNSVSLSCY